MSYRIFTDSTANLKNETIKQFNIGIISLSYLLNGVEHISYEEGVENDLNAYYEALRHKAKISTSCANEEAYYKAFKAAAENGEDVLYLGFSTGVSHTYDSALPAINRLMNEYPERTFLPIDTRSGSLGEGMLVIEACKMRETGAPIEKTYDFIENVKFNACHLFTIDDLYCLYQGGRIPPLLYKIGTFVRVKPILHVNNEGRIVSLAKVLSRKTAINELVNILLKKIVHASEQTIYIAHGGCEEEAYILVEKIKAKINVKDFYVNIMEPVMGAHGGPDILSVYFFASSR